MLEYQSTAYLKISIFQIQGKEPGPVRHEELTSNFSNVKPYNPHNTLYRL